MSGHFLQGTLARKDGRGAAACCACGWKGPYRFHSEEINTDISSHRNEIKDGISFLASLRPANPLQGLILTVRGGKCYAWWFDG